MSDPQVRFSTSIDDGKDIMNWVGEYTYGSIANEYYPHMLLCRDKSMHVRDDFFREGESRCTMETFERDWKDDQAIFPLIGTDKSPEEAVFLKTDYFDSAEIQHLSTDDVVIMDGFKPISADECQRNFIRNEQYKNEHALARLKSCFKQGYRYVFVHTTVDKVILDEYSMIDPIDVTNYSFIFSNDKDILVKIEREWAFVLRELAKLKPTPISRINSSQKSSPSSPSQTNSDEFEI